MFNSFSASVPMTALTLDAVVRATGLDWMKVDLKVPQLPTAQGFTYGWMRYTHNRSGTTAVVAARADSALVYQTSFVGDPSR